MTAPEDSVSLVLTEVADGVALVTLNDPGLFNAIDVPMLEALDAALAAAEADPEVRVIIVTGAGERAFMAGGNIGDLNSRAALEHYQQFAELVHRVFRRFETSDKPNIAAINGYAFGGGLEMVLAMDIRLVADTAKLGLTEINLGLFPGGGGTQRLPRQIPNCIANELMFTGAHISAEQAVRYGIANRVVPRDALLDEAKALARHIAAKSPLVLKLMKRTIQQGADMPLDAGLAHERAMISLVLDTRDAHEGCSAFLEKRPPAFTGS